NRRQRQAPGDQDRHRVGDEEQGRRRRASSQRYDHRPQQPHKDRDEQPPQGPRNGNRTARHLSLLTRPVLSAVGVPDVARALIARSAGIESWRSADRSQFSELVTRIMSEEKTELEKLPAPAELMGKEGGAVKPYYPQGAGYGYGYGYPAA